MVRKKTPIEDVDDLLYAWNRVRLRAKITFIIIILYGVGTTGLTLFLNVINKGKDRTITSLEKENTELRNRMSAFEAAAVSIYGGTVSDAMTKLSEHLKSLQSEVSDIKKYSIIAQLGINGQQDNGFFRTGVPISEKLQSGNCLLNESGTNYYEYSCEKKCLEIYRDMEYEFPDFPFPVAALALCKYNEGKIDIDSLNKALKILVGTTKISNHNADHDIVLKQLLLIKQTIERK